MDKINIGYFLEDIAQEDFLRSLVGRVAGEMGLASQRIRHEVRNATGGRGVVMGGVEYGPDIAESLDLYAAGRTDTGFRHFIDELRAGLAPFTSR